MLQYINPEAQKPKAVTIFTKPGRPYCADAKKLLAKRNMAFDEISAGQNESLRI